MEKENGLGLALQRDVRLRASVKDLVLFNLKRQSEDILKT